MSYFLLYSNCLVVKGASQYIICDMQRTNFTSINKSTAEIIKILSKNSISKVKEHFENQLDAEIDKFIEDLIEKELGFKTDSPKNFPALSLEWKMPYKITNAIIDISNTKLDYSNILKDLDHLGCISLEIRAFSCVSIDFIHKLLSGTETSRLRSIELLLKYDAELGVDEAAICKLLKDHRRIISLVIHSAPFEQQYQGENRAFGTITDVIDSSKHCGLVSEGYFEINIPLFTESQHHNTCLNRKISIDVDGNIKNCPSMAQSFGNIRDTTLQEALDHPDFKKYWNINKDKIHVCKDCEFRYVCTDCRAYIEDPADIYSKPLKCGYNPYTGEWSEWSTNPLKQKAIEYYGMESMRQAQTNTL